MTWQVKDAGGVAPLSLRELHLLLADEIDFMSEDDIANAPEEEIAAWLGTVDLDYAADAKSRPAPPSPLYVTEPGPIPRFALTAELRAGLCDNDGAVLVGPAGVGKSFFLHNLFLPSGEVRKVFPRCVVVDCAALRTRSVNAFEREAVWSLFGSDDDSFRRIWGSATPLSEKQKQGRPSLDLLKAVLKRRLPAGGVLAFDHMECLDEHMGLLLRERLFPFAAEQKIKLLFCGRALKQLPKFLYVHEQIRENGTPRRGAQRSKTPPAIKLARIDMGHVSSTEIDCWLRRPFFASHVEAGLTARRIFASTGGSAFLLRNFSNWLLSWRGNIMAPVGRRALLQFSKEFSKWRPEGRFDIDGVNNVYLVDCERLFRAARRHPLALFSGLRKLTGLGRGKENFIPAEDHEALLLTGAVKWKKTGASDDEGELVFTSPIHARRAKMLSQPVNMARLLLDADISQLARNNQLVQMRLHSELAADPVARWVIAERDPQDALQRLKRVLDGWGAEAIFLIRDRENARLWLAAPKPRRREVAITAGPSRPLWRDFSQFFEGASPLSAHEMPDLARTAQTGQTVIGADDKVYVPLDGNSGLIEMVVVARLKRPLDLYRRDIEIDKIAGLLRGMRPLVAQILESFALRRERRSHQQLVYRTPKVPSEGDARQPIFATLRQAECSALAVLERGRTEWGVARYEVFLPPQSDPEQSMIVNGTWAERTSTIRLDQIAQHPSGRGVVLIARDMATIFPALASGAENLALYLMPVQKGPLCRIVVFAFDGQASKSLYGNIQSRLSVVAPAIVAGSG